MDDVFVRVTNCYLEREGSQSPGEPLQIAWGIATYAFTLPNGDEARVGVTIASGTLSWVEVKVPHFKWVRIQPNPELVPEILRFVEDYLQANGI